VLDGALLGVLPPVLAPAHVPLVAKAVHDVGAVAVKVDVPTAVERAQPLDGALELHPLVRRQALAAEDLALLAGVDDDGGPSAGSGIAGAGAIRVDRDAVGIRHGPSGEG